MKQTTDIQEYAQRRFVMAGGAILREHNPYCIPVDEVSAEHAARGETLTSFAHYDYLGLAADPRVRQAAAAAALHHGVGVGASRLVGGERKLHQALEAELADFLGVEDALVMVSGYGTNFSLLGHLLTSSDLVLVDEFSHNSILAGTNLSRAKTIAFAHNDMAELEVILNQHRQAHHRTLIVVEGLYSMDGDIPNLPKLNRLCAQYNAWLMVDEAHSLGVMGGTGRGITEHFGLGANAVDLITGTLSKALCSCGGFIAGKRKVIEWLRYSLPGFVYSVGIAPPVAAAAHQALSILRTEPERVEKLRLNSARFVARARDLHLDVGDAIGAGIVPVLLPSLEAAMQASHALLQARFFVPPIVQLGIPKDKPRLRFFLSAAHTHTSIDDVLQTLSVAVASAELPSTRVPISSRRLHTASR